jgi:hypothetical protein
MFQFRKRAIAGGVLVAITGESFVSPHAEYAIVPDPAPHDVHAHYDPSTPGISANAILASGVSNGLVFLQDRENWATRSNFLVIRRE